MEMKTTKYEHLFFDLDHTLWDFEANSIETLNELFVAHKLGELIGSKDDFINAYQIINKELWTLYHQNKIDKAVLRNSRFSLALEAFDVINLPLAAKLADDYVQISPYKGKLFPDAHEVLTYLKNKYTLHLITNGFKEVQNIKIKSSKLDQYFNNLFISEEIGFVKPEAGIFHHAVGKAKTIIQKSLMIGDNYEADILGAAGVGMDTVLFNPEKIESDFKATYQIHHLKELMEFL